MFLALVTVASVSTDASAANPPTVFYLSLGASVSVGVQPSHSYPRGRPSSHGFAEDLVAAEARHGVSLELTKYGCPGETTWAMLTGADHCRHMAGSQLKDALAFLRAHAGERGLVTLDLGFNDLHRCLSDAGVDVACVKDATDAARRRIVQIVTRLKRAGGPSMTIVGLNLYDPYLAAPFRGMGDTAFATGSVVAVTAMNDALHAAYAATATPVADVATAFSLGDTRPVADATLGVVAANVRATCQLTWMCSPAPYGPNIHPNDSGYEAIAAAIHDALASTNFELTG